MEAHILYDWLYSFLSEQHTRPCNWAIFQVLTAANMTAVFWDVTPWSTVETYQLFGETCCLQIRDNSVEVYEHSPVNGGSRFFRGFDNSLPDMTSHYRTQRSSFLISRKQVPPKSSNTVKIYGVTSLKRHIFTCNWHSLTRKVRKRNAATFQARSQICEKRLLASSCLTAWNNLTPNGRIFIIFEYFSKICRENQIRLKYDTNDGYFAWTATYICDNISLNTS
jgi:hypothetical protein